MAINCKTGDTVKIRVSGGKAWLTGNITAPPTDDSVAIKANKTATKVKKSYENFKDVSEAMNLDRTRYLTQMECVCATITAKLYDLELQILR